MRILLASAVILAALSGCIQGDDPATEPDAEAMHLLSELATFPEWRMETSMGTIRTILYTDWLPQTTANIMRLTHAGYYNGTTVYRVIDDFVIQGGDENESDVDILLAGEGVPLEVHEGLDFGTGAMGLARLTRDDGTGHYFLAEKPALHLSRPGTPEDFVAEPGPTTAQRAAYGEVLGPYALYGQAFAGLDVIRTIAAVETDANDRPVEDVVLEAATIHWAPAGVDYLNLIRDVHDEVELANQRGILEIPRLITTGHPGRITFSLDTPESGSCPEVALDVMGPEGRMQTVQLAANAVDPCTFEAQVAWGQAGTYTVQLSGEDITFDVLAWHSAYSEFTGTD